jgi:small conductance mechanosensitive channel
MIIGCENMSEILKNYLNKAIEIVVILFIIYIINKLLNDIIDRVIKRRKDKNLTTAMLFLKRVKKYVLYVLGILVCLSRFSALSSLSVTILSGLGIIATVLGLAAKESLTNFFGSLGLIFGHPFEVGDYIKAINQDIEGTVEEITMRHTIIKTINNKRIIVPNSSMNSFSVENYNHTDNEICLFGDYPIAYESDINKALNIVKEEINKLYHPNPNGKNKDVEFPKVRVQSWDSSSITIRAWIWGSNVGEATDNKYSLNYILKKRFGESKIEIPYEHIDVTLKNKK